MSECVFVASATRHAKRMRLSTSTKFLHITLKTAPRKYPYFGVVVGLVLSYDPESCTGGSVGY
jgi:hypothetical protein